MLNLRKYSDLLALIFIIVFSLVIWWPYRFLPYFWDSSGLIIDAAHDLANRNFLPWVIGISHDFARPPLLMTFLGLSWKVFGQTPLASHLVMWPFLPILLYSTYLIAKKISLPLPIVPAVIVGSMPFVLAEYLNIQLDLPMAAFSTAAIAAAVYSQSLAMSILLSIAVLTKETGLLVIPGLLIFFAVQVKQESLMPWLDLLKSKVFLTKAIYLCIPVLVFTLHLIYHQWVLGWFLVSPDRPMRSSLNLGFLSESIQFVLHQIMFSQGRGLISCLGLGSFIWGLFSFRIRRHLTHSIYILSIAIVITGVLFFATFGEFALRYGVYLMPFYIIMLLYPIFLVSRQYLRQMPYLPTLVIFLIHLFVSYSHIHPTQSDMDRGFIFSPPDDMQMLDMTSVNQQAYQYLSTNFPAAAIYGAFPENLQLTQTYQGYVSTPLQFSECPRETSLPETPTSKIIYFHLYSPVQRNCGNLLLWHEHTLIKQFVQNGKWVAIFQLGNQLEVPNEVIDL